MPYKLQGTHHIPEIVQDSSCQGSAEQQQGEDVRGQQQSPSQPLHSVQRQWTKGFLTQVQTGIKIPTAKGGGRRVLQKMGDKNKKVNVDTEKTIFKVVPNF